MTQSFWQLRNRDLIKTNRPGEIPPKCDIAIVGAGIVGLALAHYLKAGGCEDVVVLEKEYAGYGASGRNAGFLLAGLAEPYSRLVIGMGREPARLMMNATLENHRLIADVITAKDISCGYQKPGSYHLATSDFEARELLESVELLNADGIEGEYINPVTLNERLGFGHYRGAQFCPYDGNLDPFAFVNGLARDVRIVEGFEVKSIEKAAGHVRLNGNDGKIDAEMAILATNAYSPLLDSFFEKLVFPVRGQMLATREGLPNPLRKNTYYANFGYDYFRSTPENVVLMGGLRNRFIEDETGFDDKLNTALQTGLEDYIIENLGVRSFDVACRWSGVMGNTIDGLPLVGSLPHNSAILAAVGYNGHGFGLGMTVARDLAGALLSGETSDLLRRFSIKRFS